MQYEHRCDPGNRRLRRVRPHRFILVDEVDPAPAPRGLGGGNHFLDLRHADLGVPDRDHQRRDHRDSNIIPTPAPGFPARVHCSRGAPGLGLPRTLHKALGG